MKTQLQTIRNSITKILGVGLFLLSLGASPTKAQINYSVTNLTGLTYAPIVGGTVINTNAGLTAGVMSTNQDDGAAIVTLPFTFTYNGNSFTQVTFCTNGWIGMGNQSTVTAAQSRAPGNLFTTTVPNNAIGGWFRDMGANFPTGTGSMVHGSVGTDVYAFEFRNACGNGFSDNLSATLINFKFVIYGPLSTNPGRIELLYGAVTGTGTPDVSTSIGIENAVGGTGNYLNALNGLTNSTLTSSAWPGSGTGYRFDPFPPCTAPASQATSLTFPLTFPTQINLSFTAATPAPSAYLIVRYPAGAAVTSPVDGSTYVVGQNLGLGTVVSAGSGTTSAASGLTPSTSYDFYVYSYNFTPGTCTPGYNTTAPLFANQTSGSATSNITTAVGGNWSAATTWVGGYVPSIYDTAYIASGATVIVDVAVTTPKLILNANSQVFLNANLLDSTDLVINSGATFNGYYGITGRTLTLFGDIINNGTLNMNRPSGLISMSGTIAQNIGGTGSFSLIPTLTVNNTAGVALNSNITVPVALNLTKGILGGTGTLTLGNSVFSNIFTMTSNGGSVSGAVASGLTNVGTVTYNYNAPSPVAGYTTGNELTITSPTQTVTFAAMAANYTLGTNATLNNVTFNDTLVVDLPMNLTVNGNASFAAAPVVNGSGTFTMGPNSTLTTTNLAGIQSIALTGSVQVGTRNYSPTANYTYNGAATQVTGDGLPILLTGGTVTMNTTSGTTLSQGTTFNNLTLTTALLSNGNTITVNGTGTFGTVAITGTGTFTAGASSRLLLSGVGTGYLVSTGANGNIQVTGGRTYSPGLDIVLGGSMTATGDNFPTTGIDSLVMNQTSAVVMSAPTTVNTLYITSTGRINTTTNLLTIAGTNGSNVARISTGYIDGPLARTVAPGSLGSFVFPLGSGTLAGLGLEIVNPTVTGSPIVLTAVARSLSSTGTAGSGLTAVNTNRYWAIAPVGGSGTLASVGNIRLFENTNTTIGAGRKIGFTTANSAGAYNSIGGQIDSISISILSSQVIPAFATGSDSTYLVIGAGANSGSFTAGTYSVGPTGDFGSLTSAIAAITERTSMTGPVVLEFQTTYNPAVETYPIVFKATLPTTSVNTLTIRPSSGVSSEITFSGTTLVSPQGLFEFNGGKNIVIDGRPGGTGTNRYLAVTQRQVGTYPAVRFINDGQNVNLKWLTLTANNASTTSGVVVFSTTTGTTVNNGNNNDTLNFCNINGNSTSSNGVYVLGSASPAINRNGAVLNCNIYDLFTNGGTNVGVLLSTTGDSAWSINNNNFYQTAARTPFTIPALTASLTYIGVQVNNSAGGGFVINNNYIGANPAVSGSVFTYGDNSIGTGINHTVNGINMVVNGTVPSSVQGNTISNINLFSSSTSASNPFQGIFVSNGFVNMGDITPNIIGASAGNGALNITYRGTSTGTCYGLRHAGVQGGIYNSAVGSIDLNISGTASTSGTLLFVGLNTGNTYTSTLTIDNNTVGSLTTPNSIRGLATAAGVISIYGGQPNSHNGFPLVMSNNKIANITNFNTNPSSSVRGIVTGTSSSTSTTTYSGNIIRDLTNAAPNLNTNDASAVVGMGTVTGAAAGTQIFTNNSIYNLVSSCVVPAAVNIVGIYYNSTTTASYHTIDRNFIHSFQVPSSNYLALQSGITLAGGSNRVAMINNMIALGVDTAGASNTGSQFITGINKTGGVASILFNSVYIGGSGVVSNTVNTFALRRTVTGSDSIFNNIFVNARSNASGTGVNFAVSLNNNTTTFANTNVFYAPGTGGKIGSFNATDVTTIPAWKVATGIDLNSFSADPAFIAPAANTANSNLHISAVTATPIEGTGTLIASITTDFDNQIRSGLSPVDIGSDAGNFIASDVVPPALTVTPVSATSSTGSIVLTATVTDATGVSTTGSLRPTVYYKKSVLGTYFASTGSLTSGTGTNGTWTFTINPTNVGGIAVGDTMFYFFAAEDLTPFTSLATFPAGGSGANVSAITTFPPTPYSYRVLNGINGTFHIGASQPFTTITDMMANIMTKLVDGNITLFLDVDYNSATEPAFPIVLPQFSSDLPTRTITIKPDAGVTDTIRGTSATSIIKIDGGDNYIIDGSNTTNGTSRDLTIQNLSTASGTAVVWNRSLGLGLGANNNTIKNCIIKNGSTSVSNYGVLVGGSTIPSNGDDNDNITIQNDSILSSAVGIYAFGTSNASSGGIDNLSIDKNIILFDGSIVCIGIQTGYAINSVVNGNYVDVQTNVSNQPVGISIEDGFNSSIVRKNIIARVNTTNTGGYGGRGITIGTGMPNSNVTVVNNVVYGVNGSNWSGFTNSSCIGIGIGVTGSGSLTTTTGGVKLYYNTISMTGSMGAASAASITTALYVGTGATTLDIRNNIFSNTQVATNTGQKNYAFYSAAANTSYSILDYNDYWVANSFNAASAIIGFLGSDRVTLANWKTATALSVNSANIDPLFASPTTLKPGLGTVSGLGTPLGSVTTDIIDSIRNNPPTIGAYEKAVDLNAPTIAYTPPGNDQNPINSRVLNGFATITDFSGVNVTAGTKPRMYYKKKTDANAFVGNSAGDNGWKWVEATNATSPYNFVVDYTIINGGFVLNLDTIQYFVVAQDNVTPTPNVGSMQAAGFVGTSVSAITSAPTTPDYYIIINLPPLAGNYNVGVSQTYTTITAAVNDLSLRGASDSVIFTLMDATYGPSETFPINLAAYQGASNINTVTIRPSVGINSVITGSAGAPAVFKMTNANNYIIDGLNTGGSSLTLTSTNTGTSSVIWLASTGIGNKNIRILNTTINGGSNSSTTAAGIAATLDGSPSSGGADNDSISIIGNTINKCFYGIYANGTAAISAGGLDAWTITDNLIGPNVSGSDNIGFAGIWMNNALNVNISRDSIRNVITATTVTTGGSGIQLANVNRAIIHQNILRDITSTTSTSGVNSISAINLGANVINSKISRNTIRGIASTTTGGYGAKAIIVNTSAGANDTLINNMISDVWCFVDVNTIYWPVGIDIEGASGDIKVYNNSINIFGTHTGWASATGSTGAAALFVSATGTGIDVRNNILVCSYDNPNVTIDKSYSFYALSAPSSFSNINYNNYYVNGAPAILAFYNTADQTSLAALQTATGLDGSSINDSTNFVSQVDLHLAGTTLGNLAYIGKSFAFLTHDIDGDARVLLYPYMGADESTTFPLPVKLTAFNAAVLNAKDVLTTWTTATEINNARFEVERSTDGKIFEKAGSVKGAGNSSRELNYRFVDNTPFEKANTTTLYYRLKQVDFDGHFTYSPIVRVAKTAVEANAIVVYPNPYSTDFNISFAAANSGEAMIEIVDIHGRLVATQFNTVTSGNNTIAVIESASLNSGIYFVRFTVNGESTLVKLVKN
jgi:hypothetical protein